MPNYLKTDTKKKVFYQVKRLTLHPKMHHFTRQSASFHAIKNGRLRNDLHQLILPLFINIITTPNKLIPHYKYPNTQRRRCSANIPMNASTIMNVLTTQRHMFYTNISMNVFGNINALMVQRRRCCAFDSPGLARNEPTLGERSQGDSTL